MGREMNGGKRCSVCQTWYDNAAASFHVRNRAKDYLQSRCRACEHQRKVSLRRTDRATRPKMTEAEFRERERLRAKEYRARSPDTVRESCRRYRQQNSSARVAYNRRYRQANPERAMAFVKAGRANRKALLRGKRGTICAADHRRLMADQNGQCFWCDKSLAAGHHIDHVIPLVLGGVHHIDNLVLACGRCNMSKRARHPADFNRDRWESFQRDRGRLLRSA